MISLSHTHTHNKYAETNIGRLVDFPGYHSLWICLPVFRKHGIRCTRG